ncbi:hypothetical protein ACTXT7_010038 [Hymenolepis weldensis]
MDLSTLRYKSEGAGGCLQLEVIFLILPLPEEDLRSVYPTPLRPNYVILCFAWVIRRMRASSLSLLLCGSLPSDIRISMTYYDVA